MIVKTLQLIGCASLLVLSACGNANEQAARPSEGPQVIPASQQRASDVSAPAASPESIPATQTSTAAPDGPMKVMVVMDSSGSMWGQIDKQSKRDIARAAIRSMAASNPELQSAGLIAYGHRRKGDCADIEVIRQPGGSLPLADAVDALTPIGKTPLSAAVKRAADELKIEENRATVILVTDGIETCDADPCALGEALEAAGIDFTAHVIGFGLTAEEGRKVACLASATGGRYLEASNAGELSGALETVAEAVETGPVAPITATATVEGPADVEIGSSFKVKWTGPNAKGDYVDLVPAGYDRTYEELSYGWTKNGSELELRAPTTLGPHEIRYVFEAPQGRVVIARAAIEVVDAEVALSAPATVQVGEAFTVTWKGPGNSGDYVDLVPAAYDKTYGERDYFYAKEKAPGDIEAPAEAGDYQIRYIAEGAGGRKVLKSVPLTVTEAKVELAFEPSGRVGGVVSVDWSGPNSKGDYIDLVPAGTQNTYGEITYKYTNVGSPLDLEMPSKPGIYDIRYVLQAPDDRRILHVAQIKVEDVDVSLTPNKTSFQPGEKMTVAFDGPNSTGDYIDLVPTGTKNTYGEITYKYTNAGSPVELEMPSKPGIYDIRYVLQAPDDRRILRVAQIKVEDVDVSLTPNKTSFQPGEKMTVAFDGPDSSGDYIDLVPRGNTVTSAELAYAYTKNANPARITLPDVAGEYDIRYILAAPDGRRIMSTVPITVK